MNWFEQSGGDGGEGIVGGMGGVGGTEGGAGGVEGRVGGAEGASTMQYHASLLVPAKPQLLGPAWQKPAVAGSVRALVQS